MPALTFYLLDAVANGVQRLDEAAPADALTSVGWNVGQLLADNSHMVAPGAEVARTSIGWTANTAVSKPGTAVPAAQSLRTGSLHGSFAAGDWTFTFASHATSAGTHAADFRVRLWRSANADGSSATMISQADLVSATSPAHAVVGTVYSSTLTFDPGAFTLADEYLFLTLALRIVTAGNADARNVLLAAGSARTRVATASWSPGSRTLTVPSVASAEAWGAAAVARQAPVVLGKSHATGTPDATITTPAETETDNLLILWVSNDNGSAAAPTITGFTQKLQQSGNNHRSWVFERKASSADAGGGASYTVDFASGASVAASMLAIRFGDSLESLTGSTITPATATHATASVTPAGDDVLALAFFGVDITATPDASFYSTPTDWTEVAEYDGTNGTRHVVQGLFRRAVPTPAATSATTTTDSSTDGSNAIMFVKMAPVTRTVSVPSVESGEAWGAATVTAGDVSVAPGSVASAETWGAATLSLEAAPASIASAEAFGAATVSPGPVTLAPGGVGSAEAWGTASVASAEAWGTAAVTQGQVSVAPASVPTEEAWGAVTVVPGAVTVAPGGVASAEAWGTVTVASGGVVLSPSSVASAEAVGTPALTVGPVTVAPGSIASQEAFGTLVTAYVVTTPGVASAEAWGAPTVAAGAVTVAPASVASAEALGAPVVSVGGSVIQTSAVPSAESFGAAQVTTGPVTVAASSIGTEVAWGAPQVAAGPSTVGPSSVGSAEAFGAPQVAAGAVTLLVAGVASGEAFGAASVAAGPVSVVVTSVASAEDVPAPGVAAVTFLAPAAVASQEAFGTGTVVELVDRVLVAVGIPSGESFGLAVVSPQAVSVLASAVASAEAFGLPSLATFAVGVQTPVMWTEADAVTYAGAAPVTWTADEAP